MSVDKRISYEIQGGVENYSPSEMVTVPKRAKSAPDHPQTELAYITKPELDLILKADFHGSLKDGPNKGPSGIMSLNAGFNEPGGFQSGGNQSAAESGNTGAFGPGAQNKQRAMDIRSAAINAGAGQKVNAGWFGGKFNNTVTEDEIARAKEARNKAGNHFGLGAFNATRGSKFSGGLGALLRGALSFFGGIPGKLLSGIMSIKNSKFGDAFNTFNEKMRGINPITGKANTQADYEAMVSNRKTESRRDSLQSKIDQGYNSIFGKRTGPITDKQRATLANLNTQTGVKNDLIGGNSTSTRFDGFAPRIGLQTQTQPNYQTGSVPFNPSLGNTSFSTPQVDLFAGLTKKQEMMLNQRKNQYPDILGAQEMLNNISSEDDPNDPATVQDIETFYGANGGLASMFTRRR